MAYIDIKELSYWYPEEAVESIRNVNIEIQKGEIVFISGKSGSGKSTLGKIISGAIPNFYGGKIKGHVSIGNQPLKDMSHVDRARAITMVFQDPERQLVMNRVHREIAFGLENTGIESKEIKRRVWESMQFTNICDLAYREVSTLSGGQKQRVAIASALACMPQCIILDEPTSQLDPAASEEVTDLVRKINEELGITIIVIEQRVDKWFDLADRVVLMDEGSLIFNGTREEFYKDAGSAGGKILPVYLRLAARLGMKEMPHSLKILREELAGYSFVFNSEEERDLTGSDECIRISDLNFCYGELKALKEIDMKVNDGEFISILGPNGAGKSTLLKTVTGLTRYEGSIRLKGREVRKLKLQEISRIIGYVSQNPNDYISKDTVYDEIRFTLDAHGIKDYSAIDAVLKKLDIYKLRDKNPRDISGGERQRVAIASILVTKPEILVLDEPTRGLDLNIKNALGVTLKELNNNGMTIILVTHDIEFASEFSNRFILMFNGEVIADGERKQVLTNGIYYTTVINKLLRGYNKEIFSLDQIVEAKKK